MKPTWATEDGYVQLYHGEALKVLATLPAGSVDVCIADPPYGITECEWDVVIPFKPMWKELQRVCKPDAPIVLHCQQPFTTLLIYSNRKRFKYCWVWNKRNPRGFLNAKYRPMQKTEDIAVFSNGGKTTYYPQMRPLDKPKRSRSGEGKTARKLYALGEGRSSKKTTTKSGKVYSKVDRRFTDFTGELKENANPTNLLNFKAVKSTGGMESHPTQKPVPLMKYLIKTYSREGDVVLDFTMGSGTTGVAALGVNRKFIGIEMTDDIFETALDRVSAQWRLESEYRHARDSDG